jgi:hypothetical protein
VSISGVWQQLPLWRIYPEWELHDIDAKEEAALEEHIARLMKEQVPNDDDAG